MFHTIKAVKPDKVNTLANIQSRLLFNAKEKACVQGPMHVHDINCVCMKKLLFIFPYLNTICYFTENSRSTHYE